MNWNLITYADETFGNKGPEQQKFIHRVYKNLNPHIYNRELLESTNFYLENKEIFDHKETGGFWAWKPFVILDAFSKGNDGDFFIYCDRKDIFSPGIFDYVLKTLNEDDFCLLLLGDALNKQYTKRDTFILMNCDEKDYWNSRQLEAGFSIWKKCPKSIEILNEYLEYCLDYKVVSADKSELGEEFAEFKEHRYDQSILTNIAIREGLPVGGSEYRNYIECDYDYWYERYPSSNLGREIDSFLLKIKDA